MGDGTALDDRHQGDLPDGLGGGIERLEYLLEAAGRLLVAPLQAVCRAEPADRYVISMAISELAQLPKQAIWVVFEDVDAEDWYVGAATVASLKKSGAL